MKQIARYPGLNSDHTDRIARAVLALAQSNQMLVSPASPFVALQRSVPQDTPDLYELRRVGQYLAYTIARGGCSRVITTICPDYWIEQDDQTGKTRYTMDGMDGGGYIGERVAQRAPIVLQMLADTLQLPVEWYPGCCERRDATGRGFHERDPTDAHCAHSACT